MFAHPVYPLWLLPRWLFRLNFTFTCDPVHSVDPSLVAKSSSLGRTFEARSWSRPVDLARWPKTFQVHYQSPLSLACSDPFADSVHSYSQFRPPTQSLPMLMATPACGSLWPSSSQLNPVSFDLRSYLRWWPFQLAAEPGYLRLRSCLRWRCPSSPQLNPVFFRPRSCFRWRPLQPAAEPGFLQPCSCPRRWYTSLQMNPLFLPSLFPPSLSILQPADELGFLRPRSCLCGRYSSFRCLPDNLPATSNPLTIVYPATCHTRTPATPSSSFEPFRPSTPLWYAASAILHWIHLSSMIRFIKVFFFYLVLLGRIICLVCVNYPFYKYWYIFYERLSGRLHLASPQSRYTRKPQ